MPRYANCEDHVLNLPQGKIKRNEGARLHTASREMQAKAKRRSFIATNRTRAKLKDTSIVQRNGGWYLERRGELVAGYATVNEAVDAMNAGR